MSSTTSLEEDGYSLPASPPRIRAPPPSSAAENSARDEAALPEGSPEEYCRTPTSSGHRIPPQLTCPPAPRKPSRAGKRKRAPCQKEVVISGEEIEAFFRSCEVKKPAGGFRVVAKRVRVPVNEFLDSLSNFSSF